MSEELDPNALAILLLFLGFLMDFVFDDESSGEAG